MSKSEKSEVKDFVKMLAWNNYIQMINRKDVSALKYLQSDSNALFSLLISLGASNKILQKPAYREELEKHLKDIVELSIEALKGECDFSIESTENGVKVSYEDLKLAEKYSLEFLDDYRYEFLKSRNIGEVLRKSKGDIQKGIIAEYSKTESFSYMEPQTSEILIRRNIDESGFATSKTIISSLRKRGEIVKTEKQIERKGQKVLIDGENKKVIWNGLPNSLNTSKSSITEFAINMNKMIEKYPNLRNYYEEIVGTEVVDKILEILNKIHE